MPRHVNIPIFIPHVGCPNQCTFCNQRTISGVQSFDIESVDGEISKALETVSVDDECEIAFFGGSFTGIDRETLIYLLQTANKYVEQGRVKSIRCSTRPDYINNEILEILKKYNLKTIELGLQSANDQVLTLCKRGHTLEDEKNACDLIANGGFELVGQMMIGLPGSTTESERQTAEFIINSGAKAVRIYPTVVFHNTELCDTTKKKLYKPLTVEEAVERSALVYRLFIDNNIEVLRIGLHASENLMNNDTYYAGPNHPALGELVYNRIFFDKICEYIESNGFSRENEITVFVARGCTSKAVGQSKINISKLKERYRFKTINVREADNLSQFDVLIKTERIVQCT